jgi:hypothetical protein
VRRPEGEERGAAGAREEDLERARLRHGRRRTGR